MKKNQLEASSLEELNAVVEEFMNSFSQPGVYLVRGEMGAGKTTFIARLCEALGAVEEVSSPTFSLVNEYKIRGKDDSIYHFDFYRLNTPEEALDFGVEEYFDSGSWCFVEWPEMIEEYLPPDALEISISVVDGKRIFEW